MNFQTNNKMKDINQLAKEMELLSPKELLDNSNTWDAIQYYEDFKEYIVKPVKPHLKIGATSKEMSEYIPKLQEYESKLEEYYKKFQELTTFNNNLNLLIRELIVIESGLYDYVPNQYQEKLIEYAFSNGSSYNEKINILTELVEIFNID